MLLFWDLGNVFVLEYYYSILWCVEQVLDIQFDIIIGLQIVNL